MSLKDESSSLKPKRTSNFMWNKLPLSRNCYGYLHTTNKRNSMIQCQYNLLIYGSWPLISVHNLSITNPSQLFQLSPESLQTTTSIYYFSFQFSLPSLVPIFQNQLASIKYILNLRNRRHPISYLGSTSTKTHTFTTMQDPFVQREEKRIAF